jgi:hypothetical protein
MRTLLLGISLAAAAVCATAAVRASAAAPPSIAIRHVSVVDVTVEANDPVVKSLASRCAVLGLVVKLLDAVGD